MVINELVYIHGYNHQPELSFLKFPNQTKTIEHCETVVVSPYGFDVDLYKRDLMGFLNDGRKLIIDASTEIIGKLTIDFVLDLEDSSLITIYANTYELEFENDINSIRTKGGNVVFLPFFIKYMDQYKPMYSDKDIKHKDYLFLSGKSKPPRTSMVGLLSHHNLIGNGHVSFFGDGVTNNKGNFFYDKTSDYLNEVGITESQKIKIKDGLSKLPKKLVLDVNNLTHGISHTRYYNGDYYKVVDFVIVVESDVSECLHFITEKTMKCIQQDKKFILLSSKGSLTNLKHEVKEHLNLDITHLTDWCDTSYDEIGDIWKRLDKIINIIEDKILN